MSHKPAYVGKSKKKAKTPEPPKATPDLSFVGLMGLMSIAVATHNLLKIFQTTTGCGSPVSPVKTIGRGARRKPGSRTGAKK